MFLNNKFINNTSNIENEITIDIVKQQAEKIFETGNELKKNVMPYRDSFQSDKEFYKSLLSIYLEISKGIIETYGDYEILGINRVIQVPKIESLIHTLIYNQKDNIVDKIKIIKNIDISLEEIIYMEKRASQYYFIVNTKQHLENTDNFEKNGYNLESTIGIVLNTIMLVRIIKYGFAKADIAYFDENGKVKKVFKNRYKMIGFTPKTSTQIKVFYKDDIDYEALLFYTKEVIGDWQNNLENIGPAVWCALFTNVLSYENFRDYEKYLLGPEYNNIIKDLFVFTPLNTINQIIPPKTLTKRKILVPKGGVVLSIEDNNEIDGILIKEIEKSITNNLLIIVRYKDGKEAVNSIILQENEEQAISYFEKADISKSSLLYVYDFLGIDEEEIIKEYDNSTLKYSVVSPYYWKYRFTYSCPEDKKDSTGKVINRVHKVEIASFIRKSKGGASASAKQLAKKLCVELEEGYTIVRSHTRRYGASLDNK